MLKIGSFVKVWDKSETGMRISTGYKKKDTEEYVTTFSGWVTCKYGPAKEKLASVETGARIKVLDMGNETFKNEKTGNYTTGVVISDFEPADTPME